MSMMMVKYHFSNCPIAKGFAEAHFRAFAKPVVSSCAITSAYLKHRTFYLFF